MTATCARIRITPLTGPDKRDANACAAETPSKDADMPDDRRAQELRRLLFAGRHREIVESTLDSADGQVRASELAYVVGALALLGRVDEALACGESAPIGRPLVSGEAIEVDF